MLKENTSLPDLVTCFNISTYDDAIANLDLTWNLILSFYDMKNVLRNIACKTNHNWMSYDDIKVHWSLSGL